MFARLLGKAPDHKTPIFDEKGLPNSRRFSNVLLPLVETKREKGRARRKRNEARQRARSAQS